MTLKKGLYFKEDNQVSFMESLSLISNLSVFASHRLPNGQSITKPLSL